MILKDEKPASKEMCIRDRFPYYYRNPEGMPQEAALDYYLNSIKDVFEQCGPADSIAAIVVEPLQGEGGFIPRCV